MHLYSPHSFHLPAATGKVYIVMESRLGEIPGAVPKAKKGGKGKGGDAAAADAPKGFEVGAGVGAAAGPRGRGCWGWRALPPPSAFTSCALPPPLYGAWGCHSSHPSLLVHQTSKQAKLALLPLPPPGRCSPNSRERL